MLEPFLSDLPVVKSSKEKTGSSATAIFTYLILLLQISIWDPQVYTRIEKWKLNELVGRERQAKGNAPSVEILLTIERFAAMIVTSVGLLGSLKVFRAWGRCPTSSTVSETAGILLEKIFFISFSHWLFEEIQMGLLDCLLSKFINHGVATYLLLNKHIQLMHLHTHKHKWSKKG